MDTNVLNSINKKLTVIIILLVIFLVISILAYIRLYGVVAGLDTVADRIDLVTSAVEKSVRSMDNGIEQIFDRMGRMRVY